MGAPIQLPGLPVATVANNGDTTLLRQGLSDFQCSIGLIRNINIAGLTALNSPSFALSSDKFMIARGGNNFSIPFSAVGLPQSAQTWFYMAANAITVTLIGWQIVPNTGDSLLAVAGGAIYTTGNTTQGTWTQPNYMLTIGQIPAHQHGIATRYTTQPGQSLTTVCAAQSGNVIDNVGKSYHTGGTGSTIGSSDPNAYTPGKFTDNFSPTPDPVQADITWRPFASVGNICKKLI